MTATRRKPQKTIRIRRQPADVKIKPAETVVCDNGHDFGLDRQKFYAQTDGRRRDRVTCPFCGLRTPLDGQAAR